jgi:hypothetical protein|tara:strand:- start:345 stop:560 length:216 start_codon:yes stop_codon:yes gene_type:complete
MENPNKSNKSYDVRKVKKGFQVVYYYPGGFISDGIQSSFNDVYEGLFDNLKDAEQLANELEHFEVAIRGGK